MWDAILDRWTVVEQEEMGGLHQFLKTVLPHTRFPILADVIDKVPCLPIADAVFLHVRGSWYMRPVEQECPNLPEWQTDFLAPTKQGVYDLDHEGWTPLEIFCWKGNNGESLIGMNRDLHISSKMAGWVHELIHVAYDQLDDSEAESEYRTRQIECEILAFIEDANLLPFSMRQEVESACDMVNYWYDFLVAQ